MSDRTLYTLLSDTTISTGSVAVLNDEGAPLLDAKGRRIGLATTIRLEVIADHDGSNYGHLSPRGTGQFFTAIVRQVREGTPFGSAFARSPQFDTVDEAARWAAEKRVELRKSYLRRHA